LHANLQLRLLLFLLLMPVDAADPLHGVVAVQVQQQLQPTVAGQAPQTQYVSSDTLLGVCCALSVMEAIHEVQRLAEYHHHCHLPETPVDGFGDCCW
jgi:hypothetical protein